MISDCDKRSSIKSRSASLVSSLFESATSIIHPLERHEPTELESSPTPIFDSLSSRNAEIKRSVQLKR